MKKNLNLLLTVSTLLVATIANAQFDSTYTQYYDYTGGILYSKDVAEDIDKDASGNYYVAGEISNGTADQDVHIIKYKTNGTNTSINYTTTNYYENVKKVLCSGTQVFVINNSYGVGLQGYRMSILRYNSSLVLQNAAYYHTDSLFEPVDACLDAAGNIYVACRQSNGAASNLAVVKLTSGSTNVAGITQVFYSSLTDSYTEQPKDIFYNPTTDRIYVAGGITKNSNGKTATLLVKINPTNMSEVWRKTSGFSTGQNIFNSVVESSTKVYVAGCKKDSASANINWIVSSYNLSGSGEKTRKYTGPSAGYNYNEALEIVSAPTGELNIVGCSKDSVGNKYDIIYAEFGASLSGSPVIIRQTLPYNSEIKDAAYESGGGYVYVTGRKAVGSNQNMFFCSIGLGYRDSIINRNSCGNKIYVIPAGPGSPPSAKVIGYQDKNNNLAQPTDLKFFYRKYIDTDIARVGVENSNTNAEVSLYPNPASDQFTIRSSEKINQLLIIDAFGRIIYQSNPASEIFETQIDISNYKSGIYFIRVNSSTQKLVKN